MSEHIRAHVPNAIRVEQERDRFQAALDEYLTALDRASTATLPEKKRTLLAAYAEFRYQIKGGTHCTACHAPVRHAMTVEVARTNGTTGNFAALCTRCLEGEKAQAKYVTLRVGPVEYETIIPAAAKEKHSPMWRKEAA